MPGPTVTIMMSPRERFSLAERAIESLYANTTPPFEFICVDAGSPRHVGRALAALARRRKFDLIRQDRYLTPNQARNIGIARVRTEYVAFVDNDTVFAPGWLDHLLSCAEETGAAIVTPLLCVGEPAHTRVHFAGGGAEITEERDGRHLRVVHRQQDKVLAAIRDELKREPCDFAEFHCMLVRTSVLRELGPLDEALKATAEHLDLSFGARARGGSIYFEPRSLVTFGGSDPVYGVSGPPLKFFDLPYFAIRWSSEWSRDSELHFHRKWNLTPGDDMTGVLKFCWEHTRTPWRRAAKLGLKTVGWRLTNRMLDLSNYLALQWARRRVQ